MERSFTSRYHGSKLWALNQRNYQKAIALDWQINNSAHTLRFFVHFLAVIARLPNETS